MPDTLNLQRLAHLYERHGRGLPPLVNLVLVIVIGWMLARLVWTVVPEPAAARWQPPVAAAPQGPTRPAASNPLDVVLNADLFGHFAPAAATPVQVEQAPETRLSLDLMGILAGPDSESRALIASSGQDEKPYAIGDDVVSGVTLEAIFPDRVILARKGKFETLRLNKDAPSTAAPTYNPAGPTADAASSQMLSHIRQEIMTDPTKASNYLRVQPATMNGQLRGYRIYPGRERDAFKQLGLRPGDLVTSVNGVQLDNNQKALELLGELSQANAVTLTIERGGQVQTLNLTLN